MGFLVLLLTAATVLVAWRFLIRPRREEDYVTQATLERVLVEAARDEIQLAIPQATGRRPKPARSAERAYITAWPGLSGP